MKKILNWLFADFLYNLYEYVGSKVCMHVAANYTFALFKNGVEVPNSRFTHTPQTYGAVTSNLPYIPIVGHTTVNISQAEITANTGDLELRCVGVPVTLSAGDLGGTVTSTARASINFQKVG